MKNKYNFTINLILNSRIQLTECFLNKLIKFKIYELIHILIDTWQGILRVDNMKELDFKMINDKAKRLIPTQGMVKSQTFVC